LNKQKVILSLLCFAVFIFLAVGSTGGNDEPKSTTEDAAPKDVAEETASMPETFEEEVEAVILKLLKETTNTDKPRIVLVVHDEDEEGEFLQAMLNADDNFTTDYIKRSIWMKSKELFEALYALDSNVDYISLFWALPLVDTYGNVSDKDVVIISLDRETADKVNWENVLTDNIPVIANTYWQHPALD